MRYQLRLLASFALGLLTLSTAARAEDLIPVPAPAQVIDQTQTLTEPEIAALHQKLAAYETAKGTQIAVLLVSTTAPEDIEQFSNRVFNAWQVGRAHIDDGLLFVIAKADRKIRLEVGRGLEGAIPDISAKRIVADQISPALKAGRYADGINAGVDAAIKLASVEKLPAVRTAADSGATEWDTWVAIVGVSALVMLAFFIAARRSQRLKREQGEALRRAEAALAPMCSSRAAAMSAAAAVTAGSAYSAQRRRQSTSRSPSRSAAPTRRSSADDSGTSRTSYSAATSSYDPPSSSGSGDSWSGGGGGSAGGGASSDY